MPRLSSALFLALVAVLTSFPRSSHASLLSRVSGHPALGESSTSKGFTRGSPLILDAGSILRDSSAVVEGTMRAIGGRVSLVAKGVQGVTAKALDMEKYPKLFAAGGLCASVTHFITVPIDVVKTRQQVNPGEFKSLSEGISSIYGSSGLSGIFRGAVPTTCGFLLQGSLKYGFYEYFKDSLALHFQKKSGTPASQDDPKKLPVPQMIIAGTAAEILGTTALLPFEATRIRMVADPTFGKSMFEVMGKIVQKQGMGGLYGGILPIMCKQIPFTIAQFLVFETVATAAYRELSRRNLNTGNLATGITLGSGIVAGVTGSLVSQPGDTVLSLMNKAPGIGVFGAVKQLTGGKLGPAGLFIGGGARMVHVSSYVVAQFLIYDSIKRLCGIPVAGSQAAAPAAGATASKKK